ILCLDFLFLMLSLPPRSTLFPYTTLFRSDSKVSLVAYERFINEEDEALKPMLLKEHVNSIKKHIDQLSAKNYHELYAMESPDFRSEEHTSELQSRENLVCRLLLEKKKKNN